MWGARSEADRRVERQRAASAPRRLCKASAICQEEALEEQGGAMKLLSLGVKLDSPALTPSES